MIVPIDQTLENLKAIIDKYEYPELFTFLDYYQAQYEQYQKKILNPFQKNSFVLDSRPAGPETGIVTEINKDEMKVNFYNRIEIFSNENNRLSRGSGKTLPLDWARKGAWGKFGRFRLKTLSHYLYLAHHFDKMQSLSNSRTQILGHQIESTYKVVSSINPRFLIADEVGLGKTVEAGLIMKEFIIRHNYHRVLIIVPASLQFQWQQEMKEKFNEEFWIIDSRSLSKLKKKLPGKVILSLDFAKQDKIKKLLLKEKWDTLIFDEAHRLRRDAVTKTLAYTLAETLCGKVNVLLLLSATPFSGKLEELYYLVRLLNPALLGSIRSFTNNYASGRKQDIHEKLESVLIRRRKVGVGGFTKRFAKTVSFEFTDEEQELYDRTTDYIRNEYNKALQTKNSLQSFILIVYQKMLDSSSYALIRTIASRVEYLTNLLSLEKEALNKVLESKKTFMRKFRQLEINGEHDSDESGETEELLKKYTEKEAADLRRELAALKEIHALALKIRINKKGETLKQVIREIMRTEKSPKILIFTQFARTQEYLAELLSEYRVSIFSGRLDKRAKDKAIVDFKNFSNILISTEAGGEGRNLQFCHYLINYDLPWNPQKIEQRIGRLHRFGQKNDVRIYNFSTKGTIGARILDVLETKIKIFEDSIGATDTLL
ncbi:MAG: DEAD/DEAH box helicase family protein, partial [Spirochaetales bacterium]|nr:DEAD/DEAH box helicase family protein [Spirochaetales bacterium]